jgi:tripartite-type tricarboxylate transporter receptor subunit TctC
VFADPVSALSQVNAGTLIAIAVTSRQRSPVAPNVPTIAESGYPGFDAIAWHGIMAPAGTPPAILGKLNAEIVKALKDPQTAKLIEAQSIQIVGSSPEAFASFIKQDVAVWRDVAREASIEMK